MATIQITAQSKIEAKVRALRTVDETIGDEELSISTVRQGPDETWIITITTGPVQQQSPQNVTMLKENPTVAELMKDD